MAAENKIIIDFQVTGLCNLRCPFCCGVSRNLVGPSLKDIKMAIDKLAKIGVDTIVLTGGEPLVRNDIVKIIKHISRKGLGVYLSTNGILLPKFLDKIKDYVQCIGLPLDGSDAGLSEKAGRAGKSYNAVIKILKEFKNNNPPFKLKIGTVVSKVNKNDLNKIAELLFLNKNIFHPNVWRLYEFSPLNYGFGVREKYNISDDKFNQTCAAIKKKFPDKKIVPLSNDASNDAYFFIDPNLKIVLLTGDKYIDIGDIKKMSPSLLEEIKRKYLMVISRGYSNRRWLFNKNKL